MEMIAVDRRQAHRILAAELSWILAVRIRPGHEVTVINLSAAGALVEGELVLAPDRAVTLELRTPDRVFEVRGRVVRGFVVGVGPQGPRYRGALSFKHRICLGQVTEDRRVVATRSDRDEPPECVKSGRSYPPIDRATGSVPNDPPRILRTFTDRTHGTGIV